MRLLHTSGSAFNSGSAETLKERLRERMEELAAHLFPSGKRNGPRWHVGDATGAPGKSFSVVVTGSRIGTHGDFAGGDRHSSSPLDLIMAVQGCDFPAACRWAENWLGLPPDDSWKQRKGALLRAKPKAPAAPDPLRAIPQAVADTLREGVQFLLGSEKALQAIADWRGWPLEGVRAAADERLIAAPLVNGKRVAAFPVRVPEKSDLLTGEVLRTVGFHFRPIWTGGDTKATWLYWPNEAQHGQRVPALPIVIDSFFDARLLIVCEGNWNALTLAIAEGWLEPNGWPAGVAVVGLRGAKSYGQFLRYWQPFWPAGAEALIICDNDAEGRDWGEDKPQSPSFFRLMLERCKRAAIVTTPAPHNDLNDAYKAGDWPMGTVWEYAEQTGIGAAAAMKEPR